MMRVGIAIKGTRNRVLFITIQHNKINYNAARLCINLWGGIFVPGRKVMCIVQ